MTILDTFSYISDGEFCLRAYDLIKILKIDLCNSESVKITWGVSGRCRHPESGLERYYNEGLRIVYPSLIFLVLAYLQSQFIHFFSKN